MSETSEFEGAEFEERRDLGECGIPLPEEGTLGIGVGELLPPEILREGEDPFESIVWFPYEERAAAEAFAAEHGYVTKEGVPL